jgi:hypothetical protein
MQQLGTAGSPSECRACPTTQAQPMNFEHPVVHFCERRAALLDVHQ